MKEFKFKLTITRSTVKLGHSKVLGSSGYYRLIAVFKVNNMIKFPEKYNITES